MVKLGNDVKEVIDVILKSCKPSGVIIMFPNYEMMKDSFNLWLDQLNYPSFIENKDKNESKNVIKGYF